MRTVGTIPSWTLVLNPIGRGSVDAVVQKGLLLPSGKRMLQARLAIGADLQLTDLPMVTYVMVCGAYS